VDCVISGSEKTLPEKQKMKADFVKSGLLRCNQRLFTLLPTVFYYLKDDLLQGEKYIFYIL
jgi:hypothetical protein